MTKVTGSRTLRAKNASIFRAPRIINFRSFASSKELNYSPRLEIAVFWEWLQVHYHNFPCVSNVTQIAMLVELTVPTLY